MATQNATRFNIDPTTGSIEGPADYLASDASKRCIAGILAGTNVVFNYGVRLGHSTKQLVEVALQTDYAAWHGMQSFAAVGR